MERAVDLMSTDVAKSFGLYPKKGVISAGADADFVMVDMDEVFTVDKNQNYSQSRKLPKCMTAESEGKPVMTVVRGRVVMENGIVDEESKAGDTCSKHI